MDELMKKLAGAAYNEMMGELYRALEPKLPMTRIHSEPAHNFPLHTYGISPIESHTLRGTVAHETIFDDMAIRGIDSKDFVERFQDVMYPEKAAARKALKIFSELGD